MSTLPISPIVRQNMQNDTQPFTDILDSPVYSPIHQRNMSLPEFVLCPPNPTIRGVTKFGSSSVSVSSHPSTATYLPSPRPSPVLAPNGSHRHNSAPSLSNLVLPPPAVGSIVEPPPAPKSGLIRRLSRGAANKLRKKASSKGEEVSGPVTMRHRSNSGSMKDLGLQHDPRSDDEEDDSVSTANDTRDIPTGESHYSTGPISSTLPTVVIPQVMQWGTTLTRVTRKKKAPLTFRLDIQSAKVFWDLSKPSSRFFVDDVKEIRVGADARNYREEFSISADLEHLWFTIIYTEQEENGKLKALHLIAPDKESFTLWTSTLEKVLKYRTEFMSGLAVQGDKFVSEHWKNELASKASERERRLSFDRVERLCRRLHVNCSRRFLRQKFNEADVEKTGFLNFVQFQNFVSLLKERAEITELWSSLAKDAEKGMNREEFWHFLRDMQKVDVEADAIHVERVFRKFCRKSRRIERMSGLPSPVALKDAESGMSMEAFSIFLRSQAFNPPLVTTVSEQDLEHPLNEYFISSSHNTYLLGRQVVGESSIEAYIKVLQRGCRCVEVDCWDGDDGRPVVYHGRTFTTKVLFSDVIAAIGKYAFLASPYPVIISLEVHCGLEQQNRMAEILRSTLEEHLVTEPLLSNSMVLPSPKDLKHKILIKVKSSEAQDIGMALSDFEAIKENSHQPTRPTMAGSGSGTSESTSDSLESDSHASLPSGEEGKVEKPKRKPKKIAPALGQLGVYTCGQKFSNFALPGRLTLIICACRADHGVLQRVKHITISSLLLREQR